MSLDERYEPPSSAVFGTKESSWQGRVPYQGCLLRGSVCFRLQFVCFTKAVCYVVVCVSGYSSREDRTVEWRHWGYVNKWVEAFSTKARSQCDQQFGTCTEWNVQGHMRSHGWLTLQCTCTKVYVLWIIFTSEKAIFGRVPELAKSDC
jgi:hypothetical protein